MKQENKWVVIGSDMDGLIGYQVVHSLDVRCLQSGSYLGSIVRGLSLNRADMEKIANELNANNEPAPENPFRNVRF